MSNGKSYPNCLLVHRGLPSLLTIYCNMIEETILLYNVSFGGLTRRAKQLDST